MPEAYKVWETVIDDRTTLICLEAHGQAVLSDDLFATLVGDLIGPPAHWNCRSLIDIRYLSDADLTRGRGGSDYVRGEQDPALREWTNRKQKMGERRFELARRKAGTTSVPPDVQYTPGTTFEITKDTITQFLEESGDWWYGLTPNEQRAVQEYVYNSNSVNPALRGNGPIRGGFSVDDLDSAIAKFQKRHDLYRGETFHELDFWDDLLRRGGTFTDEAYWSATSDPRVAVEFAIDDILGGGTGAKDYVLRIEKARGVYVDGARLGDDLVTVNEWILPRGQQYRVKSIDRGVWFTIDGRPRLNTTVVTLVPVP